MGSRHALGANLWFDLSDDGPGLDTQLLMGIGKMPEGFPVRMMQKTDFAINYDSEPLVFRLDARYFFILENWRVKRYPNEQYQWDEIILPEVSLTRPSKQRDFMSSGSVDVLNESTVLGCISTGGDPMTPVRSMQLKAAVEQGNIWSPGENLEVIVKYPARADGYPGCPVKVCIAGRYILPPWERAA